MRRLLAFYTERLNTLMFLGIVSGVIIGWLAPDLAAHTTLVGELFIRLLTLLIVPVIVVSMVGGILNLEGTGNLGRLGLKTIAYYTSTTALAVLVGIVLVNLISPGAQPALTAESSILTTPTPSLPVQPATNQGLADVLRNIVPTNIVSAAAEGNVLGLIFFSIFLAIALLKIEHAGVREVRNVCGALFDAIIWMVECSMLLAPIGVFALVASKVADFVVQGTLEQAGYSIGWYALTVVAGLLFHGVITLPLLAAFFRVHPVRFAAAMAPALTTSFSTASSAATLPITIDSLENRAGISNKVASFVAPLGATVNMDGTAIYEAVAAIFIANVYGIPLDPGQQLIVFLTATFSAVGAAGIPGAGLIMLTLVLHSVGIPVEGIALIVGIDRFLDMLRTCVNVWGDSLGAAIIARSEGESFLSQEAASP